MNPHVRPRPKVDYRVPWAHGVKLGVLPESLRRAARQAWLWLEAREAAAPTGAGKRPCHCPRRGCHMRVEGLSWQWRQAVVAQSRPQNRGADSEGEGSPRSGPQGGPARLLLLWAVGPGWWLMALPLSNCATSDGSVTSLKS